MFVYVGVCPVRPAEFVPALVMNALENENDK